MVSVRRAQLLMIGFAVALGAGANSDLRQAGSPPPAHEQPPVISEGPSGFAGPTAGDEGDAAISPPPLPWTAPTLPRPRRPPHPAGSPAPIRSGAPVNREKHAAHPAPPPPPEGQSPTVNDAHPVGSIESRQAPETQETVEHATDSPPADARRGAAREARLEFTEGSSPGRSASGSTSRGVKEIPGPAEPAVPAASPPDTLATDPAPGPAHVTPPRVISAVGTDYPGEAFRFVVRRQDLGSGLQVVGAEGTVSLRALVLAGGTVRDVTVESSSGSAVLDRAAVEAVLRWRFAPATRDGVPIDAFVTLKIRYVVR